MTYPARNGGFGHEQYAQADTPDDSQVTMEDVQDGVFRHEGTVVLKLVVDRVVYVALLLGRSVDEVARFLGISVSEVYALNARAKARMIGQNPDGHLYKGLVECVRSVAAERGRFRMVPGANRQVADAWVATNEFATLLKERLSRTSVNRAMNEACVSHSTILRARRGQEIGMAVFVKLCRWMGISEDEGLRLMRTQRTEEVRGS